MGFLDKAKQALGEAKDKASELAEKHGGKVEQAIDKAGDLVDARTKGKYADKIDKVQAQAKSAVNKLGDQAGTADGAGAATPMDASPSAAASDPVDAPDEHVATTVDQPARDPESPTA
jgi:hypothetical protein